MVFLHSTKSLCIFPTKQINASGFDNKSFARDKCFLDKVVQVLRGLQGVSLREVFSIDQFVGKFCDGCDLSWGFLYDAVSLELQLVKFNEKPKSFEIFKFSAFLLMVISSLGCKFY